MRKFALGTFSAGGRPFAALVLDDDRVFMLSAQVGRDVSVRGLLEHWDASLPELQRLADRLDPATADFALAELRPLPPVEPVGQIFQAAANYRRHVVELMDGARRRGDSSDGNLGHDRGEVTTLLDERAAKGRPFVFLGSAHSMVGAEDEVELPRDSGQSDWEIELTAVIGRPTRRVDPDAAIEAVAGYMICDDLTSRDALSRWDASALGIDWLAGKNSPTFLPTGPLLVPANHVADPMDLRMRLTVNGRTMQDESTADMLFGVGELIAFISTVTELRPGDLVLTGSPAGNGAARGVFLEPGDLIEAEIEGLGMQRNRCVPEGPTASRRRPTRSVRRADIGGGRPLPTVLGAMAPVAEQPFEGVSRETHQSEKTTVSAYSFEPGASFPIHSHDEEQVTVFLEGEMEVTVEGETRLYHAGETAVIAPGLAHGMTAGPTGAAFVALVAPRREHSNAYEIKEG